MLIAERSIAAVIAGLSSRRLLAAAALLSSDVAAFDELMKAQHVTQMIQP